PQDRNARPRLADVYFGEAGSAGFRRKKFHIYRDMIRHSNIRMAAAVAVAALLAACTESTSSTAPTNNLDIATLVSATTSANLTAGERALFSLPTTGGLPTIDPNACPF